MPDVQLDSRTRTETAKNGHKPGISIEGLVEKYRLGSIPPLALGEAFFEYRKANNCTQQNLGRLTGITAGTIHHYESLMVLIPELKEALTGGRLTFKEARALADLPPHRQLECAVPFINGQLSSGYVEPLVRLAKEHCHWSIEQLIHEVLPSSSKARKAGTAPAPAKVRYDGATLIEIQAHVVNLAGELEMLGLREVSQIDRMRVGTALRVLRTRMTSLEERWGNGSKA